MKIHRNRYIFYYDFKSEENLKVEFVGYNEKNIGFYNVFLTPKYYFPLSSGGEKAMGTYYFITQVPKLLFTPVCAQRGTWSPVVRKRE